ncbi:SAM hydrolase/SAM-dependent halogenase family protein [Terasakiella pusilla]|uniref:SAM hydrolase/SAM-dependent halogenase family protein n=1 Tax=Terasakiella pusilla TaxID=64973 RepID=UPI003AA7D6EE
MIVLFTDFGLKGPYMGQMRARIHELAPKETVVDLMTDAPAFNVGTSARLLAGLIDHMPQKAIFVCVVDPGVGSSRKPLCIRIKERWFVGPDNGLFQFVLKNEPDAVAYVIDWRPEHLSLSFHGRDLFGPVAAKLATEQEVAMTILPLDQLVILEEEQNHYAIAHIDDFGNCWVSIPDFEISKEATILIKNHHFFYSAVFSDTEKGKPFWYINSSGFVEIAVNQGDAAGRFNLTIGDRVNFI